MTDPVPSKDLVKNLRSWIDSDGDTMWLANAAADEIERLQRLVVELNAECDRWADLSNARDDAKLRASPEPRDGQ